MQSQSSIISLHIGQAGIQAGSSVWQLFSLQHSLNPQQAPIISDENIQAYFSQNESDNLQSRAIFIDLEPTAIDELRTGFSRALHRPQNLISGKEGAASNYARGHYTAGKELLQPIMDRIKKQADRCSNLQGFLIYRSLGGGTGSGLGSLIAENLSVSFGKKTKIGITIYPFPQLSDSCVEPYNSLLSTSVGLEHLDASMVFDNEAIYDICHRNLDIVRPAFSNMNGVIAQVVSSITTGSRFNGNLNVTLPNLIPYPRINSMLLSYSPIVQASLGCYHHIGVAPMTEQALQPANMMTKCDPSLGMYVSMILNYRGDVRPKDISAAIGYMKTKRSIRFVDWTPTGFRLGIERSPSVYLPRSDMAALPISCCAISNSTAISHMFGRLAHKFDLLYSKQAFLHSYTSEGMEINEFMEARQDMAVLEGDYSEIQIEVEQSQEG